MLRMIQHASKNVLGEDVGEGALGVCEGNLRLPKLLHRAILIAADTQGMHIFELFAIFDLILDKGLSEAR